MTFKEKYKAFRIWQKKPYTVAAMSEKEHDCYTCHTHFRGNFCPRCGQSSNIERYSLKDTIAQFVAVWGVGNRSFFRCLRDLLLRPGYMIRDYLNGMQMAYYPPFQLLSTLVVASWVWISFLNHLKPQKTTINEMTGEARMAIEWAEIMMEKFPEAIWLYMMLFYALSTFLFYRKSKKMPKLQLSESLIVAVYCTCLMSLYNMFINTSFSFCEIIFNNSDGYFWGQLPLIMFMSHLAYIIPLNQLFGGSWMRSISCVIAGDVLFVMITLIGGAVAMVIHETFPANLSYL